MKTVVAVALLIAGCGPSKLCRDTEARAQPGQVVADEAANRANATPARSWTWLGPMTCAPIDRGTLTCSFQNPDLGQVKLLFPSDFRLSQLAENGSARPSLGVIAGSFAPTFDVTVTALGPVSPTGRDLRVQGLACDGDKSAVAFNGFVVHTAPGE